MGNETFYGDGLNKPQTLHGSLSVNLSNNGFVLQTAKKEILIIQIQANKFAVLNLDSLRINSWWHGVKIENDKHQLTTSMNEEKVLLKSISRGQQNLSSTCVNCVKQYLRTRF